MANKVKVDHTAISDAVLNISKAIDTYNTLAQTGFDTAISSLDGMNSDYIDKLQQVLDCLNPKIKEEISDTMSAYIEKTEDIAETIKEIDEKLAGTLEGE